MKPPVPVVLVTTLAKTKGCAIIFGVFKTCILFFSVVYRVNGRASQKTGMEPRIQVNPPVWSRLCSNVRSKSLGIQHKSRPSTIVEWDAHLYGQHRKGSRVHLNVQRSALLCRSMANDTPVDAPAERLHHRIFDRGGYRDYKVLALPSQTQS